MSGQAVIGTAADCDVRVHGDRYVSPHHAGVVVDDTDAVWITDLGSTNGTYLQRGGTRLPVRGPTRMYPGDVLWVGRTPIPWHRSDEGRRA